MPEAKGKPTGHDITDQLREVIASRGLTPYALEKMTGIDNTVIMRFLSRERDIRFETAATLARTLGLRLVEVAQRPTPKKASRPAKKRKADDPS